jgi:uncharacterized membrane protein YbhN (UPF0104 family)
MDGSQRSDAPAINQSNTRLVLVRFISLYIVVMVLLYAVINTLSDWNSFLVVVSKLPGALWVQVVALSLLSYLIRFVRWHHFIVSLGHRVPVVRNLEVYLSAFALTITPGKAGETIRSIYLHPYGVSYPHSIGAFVSERLLDLVAVGALAVFAIKMLPDHQSWAPAAILAIVAMILLFRSSLITLIGKRTERIALLDNAAKVVDIVGFLLSGRQIAVALPLSLMAWMAQGASLYLIVEALGYELGASTVMAIYCLSILAGAASFIPGGLGATETAIVLLLSIVGVGQADAITASLVSRSLTLWLAVAIGVLAMTKTSLTDK